MPAPLSRPLLPISDVTLTSCVSKTERESGTANELTHFIHSKCSALGVCVHTMGRVFKQHMGTVTHFSSQLFASIYLSSQPRSLRAFQEWYAIAVLSVRM